MSHRIEQAAKIAYRSLRLTDADEFALAVSDACCTYIPIGSGEFEARITQLQVGDFTAQRSLIPASITRGLVHSDRYGVLFGLNHSGGLVVNGHAPGQSDVLLLGAGAAIDAVCPQPQSWASIACGAVEFEALLDTVGMDVAAAGLDRQIGGAPGRIMALGRAVGALADLVDTMPSVLHAPGIEQSLADALRDMLARSLAGVDLHAEPSRLTREMLGLVNRADEYMREHVARPIYTEELCTALGVSPRKLHKAFASMYGLSPHAYLKRRRLMLVHRALRTDMSDRHLVKSVALAHGFWHLGNFARDYRAMFGRSPSDTRPAAMPADATTAEPVAGMGIGQSRDPML